MANRAEHIVTAGALTAIGLFLKDAEEGEQSLKLIGGAGLAALCATIPDVLEPASHPHHRQFFHSMVFAGIVGVGMKELSDWKTETEFEEFLRFCLLCAGAGILLHLAMDALTPRSLPLLGKL